MSNGVPSIQAASFAKPLRTSLPSTFAETSPLTQAQRRYSPASRRRICEDHSARNGPAGSLTSGENSPHFAEMSSSIRSIVLSPAVSLRYTPGGRSSSSRSWARMGRVDRKRIRPTRIRMAASVGPVPTGQFRSAGGNRPYLIQSRAGRCRWFLSGRERRRRPSP